MSPDKKNALFEFAAFKQYTSGGDNSEHIKSITKKLKNAIDSELTATQREVVLSYYFEGMTIPEIAALKGINKSSVSRALCRARRRLERVLKYSF